MFERIVLVPSYLAHRDESFIFVSPASECNKCKHRPACVEGLISGRIYRIIETREKTFECPVHGEVKPAKITMSDVRAALPEKVAIEGAIVNFTSIKCNDLRKDMYTLCNPVGIKPGDRVLVKKVEGFLGEYEGERLVLCIIRPY
ncbi:UPF0179 family protein [Candidatus Methanodesulfokora washburnensis]|jgi:uncharacterized protein (UPF0179 family)|nr:UPF0179 family protein [Candidatus Methanodesulfokores washburnensis]